MLYLHNGKSWENFYAKYYVEIWGAMHDGASYFPEKTRRSLVSLPSYAVVFLL